MGIREQQLVQAGGLRVEEDARFTGETHALDVRSPGLTDQQHERPPGAGLSSSTSISHAGSSRRISIRTVETGLSTRYLGRSRSAVDIARGPAPLTKAPGSIGDAAARLNRVPNSTRHGR